MTERFAPRAALRAIAQIADALDWPRSRPARLLAGDRASMVSSLVLCADEDSITGVEAAAGTAVVLATPPSSSDGHLGRRVYDPFAGSPDDVSTWRRAERVVLDASLLLTGASGGVDEHLAERVGIADARPARTVTRDVDKFVGYVPTDAFARVRDAVLDAGAGAIGEYDRCSWSTQGTGTFRGGETTNPAVGSRGEFEQVEEIRFETVVASHLVDAVVRAYAAAHPYEEPAFDVLRMNLPARVGFGRHGTLGSEGGRGAWSALAEIDPQLTAHGAVDAVPAGAHALVHAGPLRDVLGAATALDAPALAIVGVASDVELDLLARLGVAVLVVDRARAFDAHAHALAGRLTRALELPVTVHGGGPATAFPSSADSQDAVDVASSIFDEAPAGVDYAAGTWRLHFDGGSRGNPGPAAYGWVLYDPSGHEHEADGVRLGSTTNNVAEWTGLLRGLEHAIARGIRKLDVRGDSELVVKQVTGVYKVKNAALKPIAEDVARVLRNFDAVDVRHVYRNDNARADAVANEAMDGLR